MQRRVPLVAKILLLGLLNLALLAAVLLTWVHYELRASVRSLLFAPAEERVVSVARQFALDLAETPLASRDDLLDRYSRLYSVRFYLFQMVPGRPPAEIGGPAVTLPEEIETELRRPPRQDAAAPIREPRTAPPPRKRNRPRDADAFRGEGPPPGGPDDGPPGEPPPPAEGPPPQRAAPPPPRDRPAPNNPELRPAVFAVASKTPALYWAGARIPLRQLGNDIQDPGVLLMSAASFAGTPLFFDYKPWLTVTGALILVFIACWLPFIRGLTRTITKMSHATEHIAEGRFDQPLAETRKDELGDLAAGINRMSSRLSALLGGQKRFLGDVAHELCAPLARIQFGLGVLEHRVDEEQRASVDTVGDDVRQMSGLVEELLAFSRTGLAQKDRPLIPVDLDAIVRRAIDREGLSIETVDLTIDEGLRAIADPDALLRSLANILRNAVRYAGDAGTIALTARRDNNEAVIVIADQGPGIPEEEVDRIFEPFYRIENSRHRDSGGAGLGLAIVRSAIEACHGTVVCRNRKPTGLEVEIRLGAAAE